MPTGDDMPARILDACYWLSTGTGILDDSREYKCTGTGTGVGGRCWYRIRPLFQTVGAGIAILDLVTRTRTVLELLSPTVYLMVDHFHGLFRISNDMSGRDWEGGRATNEPQLVDKVR